MGFEKTRATTSSIRIYSTSTCPFCHAAKDLFTDLGYSFTEILLDDDPELRQRLGAENGGWSTVPMIFIGDRFIGGFTDAAELHQKAELLPLLNSGL